MDSPNYDISQATDAIGSPSLLQNRCDYTPGCVGINSNGWMKRVVLPQAQWVRWTNDASKGFYKRL